MNYCTLCGFELSNSAQHTRWIHDIIFHQEYFEGQIIDLTKEQIIDAICTITKSLYFDEN